MAYEVPRLVIPLICGAVSLAAQQYHLVKLSADNKVVICDNVVDVPIGVLQNDPDAEGKVAEVLVLGISKVQVGAVALTYGLAIGPNATGEAITETNAMTTHYSCGRVIEGAAANAICTAMIDCLHTKRLA